MLQGSIKRFFLSKMLNTEKAALVGGFKLFLNFTPKIAEMIQFDYPPWN